MSDGQRRTRKTRFVCISDTHNAGPGGGFKLPKGDVLIHAGDMTNQGSFSELKKTIEWLEGADFEAKIVIAGNHDITLDSDFYAQFGLYFHNQNPQDSAKCQELLERSPSLQWLKHESTVVSLASRSGPHTTFKIFGSPYSPTSGMWAFGYNTEEATHIWDRIPLDSDIVRWEDPGLNSKKISLVDLTARGWKLLDNDGAPGDLAADMRDGSLQRKTSWRIHELHSGSPLHS
ncbi:Metallo-dependent phosphatase [Diplocarpon rosae]|nr:Metallo-dependent phosphatase [Diplocarpon rosae]